MSSHLGQSAEKMESSSSSLRRFRDALLLSPLEKRKPVTKPNMFSTTTDDGVKKEDNDSGKDNESDESKDDDDTEDQHRSRSQTGSDNNDSDGDNNNSDDDDKDSDDGDKDSDDGDGKLSDADSKKLNSDSSDSCDSYVDVVTEETASKKCKDAKKIEDNTEVSRKRSSEAVPATEAKKQKEDVRSHNKPILNEFNILQKSIFDIEKELPNIQEIVVVNKHQSSFANTNQPVKLVQQNNAVTNQTRADLNIHQSPVLNQQKPAQANHQSPVFNNQPSTALTKQQGSAQHNVPLKPLPEASHLQSPIIRGQQPALGTQGSVLTSDHVQTNKQSPAAKSLQPPGYINQSINSQQKLVSNSPRLPVQTNQQQLARQQNSGLPKVQVSVHNPSLHEQKAVNNTQQGSALNNQQNTPATHQSAASINQQNPSGISLHKPVFEVTSDKIHNLANCLIPLYGTEALAAICYKYCRHDKLPNQYSLHEICILAHQQISKAQTEEETIKRLESDLSKATIDSQTLKNENKGLETSLKTFAIKELDWKRSLNIARAFESTLQKQLKSEKDRTEELKAKLKEAEDKLKQSEEKNDSQKAEFDLEVEELRASMSFYSNSPSQ